MNFIKRITEKIKLTQVMPQSVTIDISNRCNACCPFCSRQLSPVQRNQLMNKDLFYDILDEISKIKTINTIVLAAFGEPLLHPNFDEFVEAIIQRGYNIGFPTNMSLAHQHYHSMLKANHIMFSIEGYNKESYEFNRKNLNFENTLSNVKEFDKLIQEQKKIGKNVPIREINCLITKNTDVDQFINLWRPYVDIIRIGPILPVIIWNKNTAQLDLKSNEFMEKEMLPCNSKIAHMHCHQPFKSIIIRPSGKLALCCSDFDIDLDFGDYKNLYKTYKKNKNLNKIRKEFKTGKLDLCKNCFQNFEIKKEELFEYMPQLKKYEKDSNIFIYSNR